MGVDLALYPVLIGSDAKDGLYSFSVLEINRRSELWPAINKLPQCGLTKATGHFGDNYRAITNDCYGEPLHYVFAKDIAAIKDRDSIVDCPINRAVWAYLSALEPDTKIVLYWH